MYREPERRSLDAEIRRLGVALHDLCQPVTTLQCRMEIAEILATPEAYAEAIRGSLSECVRMSEAIQAMRGIVQSMAQQSMEEQEIAEVR